MNKADQKQVHPRKQTHPRAKSLDSLNIQKPCLLSLKQEKRSSPQSSLRENSPKKRDEIPEVIYRPFLFHSE